MQTINEDVIKKAQKGDITSLKKILKAAEKSIYTYLSYLTDIESEKEDMAQEILVKVTKNISKLKNSKYFKSWLNKIILRQYYDFVRKTKKCALENKDITEIDDIKEVKDKKQSPIDDCICSELSGIIKKSVCKLQEPYRLAILMREFQGLSYDEIAKLTNTSKGTVKSRIARARSRLKEYIKPYME